MRSTCSSDVQNKLENRAFEVGLKRVAMTSHSEVQVQVNVYLNLPNKNWWLTSEDKIKWLGRIPMWKGIKCYFSQEHKVQNHAWFHWYEMVHDFRAYRYSIGSDSNARGVIKCCVRGKKWCWNSEHVHRFQGIVESYNLLTDSWIQNLKVALDRLSPTQNTQANLKVQHSARFLTTKVLGLMEYTEILNTAAVMEIGM